ncbi:SgcJ/EcaC family oxidoreductase [Amycolatopsis sp. CA-230715]|uniref:SgcJ/EcaC family oxidoreductase n=1 Tax=Amycolatopsis sp. CA-230715 TaxID=2745196 RepID=UPI001C02EB6C|nr:SgcJ/EcaC family oxidoreductase [Amycolatopsis sp. CA-230715]QWF81204.1 hypothetical protein HUW46_04630 [Amycolatopsis sp. CA-230715]
MIEQVCADLARAWNAGDGDAWAACFTEDADFVDVLGRLQEGRARIAAEHGTIFGGIYRGSTLEVGVRKISPYGSAVLVHTTTVLRVPEGPRAGESRAAQTMLVEDGKIRMFHNTELRGFDQFLAEGAPYPA